VCSISKKFTIAKNFTRIDYAQGLYVHLINSRWLQRLPEDLRDILLKTIAEESAAARDKTRLQQEAEIELAKRQGVNFIELSDTERTRLMQAADVVFDKWGPRIGEDYIERVKATLNE